MRIAQFKGIKCSALSVRSWAIWANPRRLAVFVVSVTLLDAVAIGVSASMTAWRFSQLALFGLLLAGSLATVERTRRAGENAGLIKDVYGVWELPIAILLPPVYALIAPIPRVAMMQWRGVSIPLHRRVFSAAAIGLAYGCASLAFHAFNQDVISRIHGTTVHATALALAMGACGVLQWVLNTCLVMTAIKGSDPTADVRKLFLAREPLHNDATEVCATLSKRGGSARCSPISLFHRRLYRSIRSSNRFGNELGSIRIARAFLSKSGRISARETPTSSVSRKRS
jgi:hypothetical protein